MGHLGYAITAHRAQGVTIDTAHTVTTATTTRENFYARGRYDHHAYVAIDASECTRQALCFGVPTG